MCKGVPGREARPTHDLSMIQMTCWQNLSSPVQSHDRLSLCDGHAGKQAAQGGHLGEQNERDGDALHAGARRAADAERMAQHLACCTQTPVYPESLIISP